MLEEALYKEKLASVKPRYSSPFLGSKKELCTPEEEPECITLQRR